MTRGGWHKESYRHSLAAKGVVTSRYMAKKSFPNIGTDKVLDPVTIERKAGAARRNKAQFAIDVEGDRNVSRSVRKIEQGAGASALGLLVAKRNKELRGPVGSKLIALEQDADKRGLILGGIERAVAQKALGVEGRFTKADLTVQQRAELLALAKKAVDDANQGVAVDAKTKAMLNKFKVIPEAKAALQILSDAESAERREREGFVASEARALEEGTLSAIADSPEALARGTAATGGFLADIERAGLKGVGEGKDMLGQGPGLNSKIEGLGKTSFVGTNTSIGNEEAGSLRPFSEPLPSLSSGFDDALRTSEYNRNSGNVLFNKQNRTFADSVDTQVTQLDQAKDKLSSVDLASFRAGTEAFESGDREGLISAISGLKREEDKIANRWSLVEQTKKNVTSVNNHQAVFADQGTDNIALQKGRGGDRIADQTDKLENVFIALKNSNDKLFARRRMLQFRLQRLDANVLPEQGAPDFDEITRFSGDESKALNWSNTADLIVKDNVGLDVLK